MKKLFAFIALGAMICFASCQKPVSQKQNEKTPDEKTPDEKTPEEETPSGITIDGSFEDWEALGDKAVKVRNNPNSPYEAVKEFRIYNDAEFIYYYIAYDKDYLKELVEAENDLPMRLNFNTDGEFTSGYEKYFQECYDFMIEGAIADAGVWSTFDAPFYQRINNAWDKRLEEGSGLALGAGKGNEYEVCVNIEMFNDAAKTSADPKPMGKTFQTGLTFYDGGWSTIAVLPNASTDDNPEGWGSLLEYTLAD